MLKTVATWKTVDLDAAERLAQVSQDPESSLLSLPQQAYTLSPVTKGSDIDELHISELPQSTEGHDSHIQACVLSHRRLWQGVVRSEAEYQRIDLRDSPLPVQDFEVDKVAALEPIPSQGNDTRLSAEEQAKLQAMNKDAVTHTPGSKHRNLSEIFAGTGRKSSVGSQAERRGSEDQQTTTSAVDTLPSIKDEVDSLQSIFSACDTVSTPLHRTQVFHSCDPSYQWAGGMEEAMCRAPVTHPFPDHSHHIAVMPLNLTLSNGMYEPFFCTLAVYDVSAGQRMSENFYFRVNPPNLEAAVLPQLEALGSHKRLGVFKVSHPKRDLVLVLRIEKVLSGDADQGLEPYIRSDASKNDADALTQQGQAFCKRLGRFRQPVAWSAIRMYNANMTPAFDTVTSFDSLYVQKTPLSDAKLCQAIEEAADPKKKPRKMPGCCIIEVDTQSQWDDYPTATSSTTTTTDAVAADSTPPLANDEAVLTLRQRADEIIRLTEFPHLQCKECVAQVVPFLSPRNDLYIYPESVNFGNLRTGIGKSKNIACVVRLMTTDQAQTSSSQVGIPAVYNHTGKTVTLGTDAVTQVTYHSKTPQFQDEIVLKLPGILSAEHHILFTFYHIPCQVKASASEQAPKVLGHSFLPLFRDERLPPRSLQLPVYTKLENGYLSHEVASRLPLFDNGRPVFKLEAHFESSIYSQTPPGQTSSHLQSFFRAFARSGSASAREASLAQACVSLRSIRTHQLMRHMPIIFDILLAIIRKGAPKARRSAFSTVVALVNRIHDDVKTPSPARHEALASYVDCVLTTLDDILFLEGGDEALPLHLAVAQGLLESLDNPQIDNDSVCRNSWFLLDVIARGLQLYDRRNTGQCPPPERTQHCDDTDIRALSELVSALTSSIAGGAGLASSTVRTLNRSLAWFVRHLFLVLPVPATFAIIKTSMSQLSATDAPSEHTNLRHDFLRILCDNELVVPLNNPVAHTFEKLTTRRFSVKETRPRRSTINREAGPALHLRNASGSADFDFRQRLSAAGGGPLLTELTQKHFIAGLLIAEIDACIDTMKHAGVASAASMNSTELLSVAVLLRDLLCKHDFDNRYQQAGQRTRLGQVYFSLILVLIKNQGVHLDNDVRQVLHLCTAYILKNVDPFFIRSWWQRESYSSITAFWRVLGDMVESFEYTGPERPDQHAVEPTTSAKALNTRAALEEMYRGRGTVGNRRRSMLINNNNNHGGGSGSEGGSVGAADSPGGASTTAVAGSPSTPTSRRTHSTMHGSPASTTASPTPGRHNNLLSPHAYGASSGARTSMAGPRPSTAGAAGRPSTLGRASALGRPSHYSTVQAGRPSTAATVGRRTSIYTNTTAGAGGGAGGTSFHHANTFSGFAAFRATVVDGGPGSGEYDSEMAEQVRLQEGALSTTVSLVVVDLLQAFVEDFHSELQSSESQTTKGKGILAFASLSSTASNNFAASGSRDLQTPLIDLVLQTLLVLLRTSQSGEASASLYRLLRGFVPLFRKQLFSTASSYMAEICSHIMRHCAYFTDSIRQNAASLLMTLLLNNFEETGSIGSVQLQVTVALSKLVSEITRDQPLRLTFDALHSYGMQARANNKALSGCWNDVSTLLQRLTANVQDTMHTRRMQGSDAELLADLYLRIASGYIHAPALYLTWLDNLATHHEQENHYAEAAMCYAHIAGYIARMLHVPVPQQRGLLRYPFLPTVIEGMTFPNVSAAEAHHHSHIVEVGRLQDFLRKGINNFRHAEMYEYANELFKLLLRCYEGSSSYPALIETHQEMTDMFEQLSTCVESQGRFFGTFYRVGFYGNVLDSFADDRREFIYREPLLTKLPEVTQRLKAQYEKKLGVPVEIITTSGPVDLESLDAGVAYIQITYVEPYDGDIGQCQPSGVEGESGREGDDEDNKQNTTAPAAVSPFDDLADRPPPTDFEAKLSSFMFETPFTQSGNVHGGVGEQYIRQTVLQLGPGDFFPSMKTRLPVAKRDEVVLTPLENAIESLNGRCDKLTAEIVTEEPNLKTLQHILMGSVLVQVNTGVQDIAKTFLEDNNSSNHDDEQVDQLRECLYRFLSTCRAALAVNAAHIDQDQHDLQCELQKGYSDLLTLIVPMIKSVPEFDVETLVLEEDES